MKKRILLIILSTVVFACSKSSGPGAKIIAAKAELIAPLKDVTCFNGTVLSATESSVAFSWSSAKDADSYELNIKNLLTNSITTQQVSGTSATVTLSRNTPYSWFVNSKAKQTTQSTPSDTWKFYNAGAGITTYAPFPAELTAPSFGQIVTAVNGKINLTWKGTAVDNNIVGYIVYFGPKSIPDIFRERVTDSFVNDVTVSANTTYYWRVVTVDANGNITDSGLSNFFVKE